MINAFSHSRTGARVLALFVTLATACGGRFEVPVPVLAAPAAAPAPIETATIGLPVTISLAKIRAGLDSIFPAVDSLDRARCTALGGLVCHQYLYRRDSLDLHMQGDRVVLQTSLRYSGRVALPGLDAGIASCGMPPEPMKRASMRLSTSLYWRSDWRLASRGTTVAAELTDRCAVTLLRVDATPLMRRLIEAQTASLRQQIDSVIPSVGDLRPAAESLWRVMQQPLLLDSASSIWLVMTPETVSLMPITGSGGAASTAMVLKARPRVVVGSRPAATQRPLPILTLANRSAGIHIPIEIEVPFSDLSQRATALLSGEVAGKGIRVGEVAVWGVGDTAVVRVGMTGKMSGSLYLLGRVAYDSAARAVLTSDLRYTLASNNAMSRVKATLGAGRIKSAIDEVTGHGRLGLGQQLDSLKSLLTRQLNRELAPGIVLVGSVTDVRFRALYTTQTAFVLRAVLDGEAVVQVR